jgi:hypothetical protein
VSAKGRAGNLQPLVVARRPRTGPKIAIIAAQDRTMPRLIPLILLTATLAACSEAGPGGYGYAVNERPSLKQLSITLDDGNNPFRAGSAAAATMANLN